MNLSLFEKDLSPESKENNLGIDSKANAWRTSNQINLREQVGNIEAIRVINYEKVMRFDKETILYIIEYTIKGQTFTTKRSYSEFRYLWKEVKKEKIAVNIPEIPSRTLVLGKTEEVINERKEAFDRFLKILIAEKVALNYLKEFLQSPSNLAYYGKISKKDSGKLVPPNNSITSDSKGGKAFQNQVQGRRFDNSVDK